MWLREVPTSVGHRPKQYENYATADASMRRPTTKARGGGPWVGWGRCAWAAVAGLVDGRLEMRAPDRYRQTQHAQCAGRAATPPAQHDAPRAHSYPKGNVYLYKPFVTEYLAVPRFPIAIEL
ncbi:hypothetical protein EVAR_95400_1 [Eumeta japonica]|uniref:Uncharacterized protein n=1 Tax=Eumeta variegata TaxID=151549 RepID=A0A4C1VIU0_EUMVA|nr:hypothetical protein EVAR_95400_1 [Eumeta japonica]